MQRLLPVLHALFLGLVILIPALAARAQEIQVEVAHPPIRFIAATGWADKKIEPSGVAPIADGSLLLVACDKNESLVVVDAATGRAEQWLRISTFEHGPKWEDLAYDDEGAYYVIGSRFVNDPAQAGGERNLRTCPV